MPATWFPHGVSPAQEKVHVREKGVFGVKGYPTPTGEPVPRQQVVITFEPCGGFQTVPPKDN